MTARRVGERKDEDIKLDVIANLRWDGRVDASSVQAEVEDGRVTLTGTVPNYTARAAAVELTRFTAGVVDVQDRLEIDIKENVLGTDDDKLAAQANDILSWHSDLEGNDVKAEVQDGVIELEGSVGEHWKADRAQKLIMGIRGIIDVKNNLAVVPTRDVADEALAEEITGALERNVLVDEDRLKVQVENGVVTLTGSVGSWIESNTVRDVVSATPGVLEIRDRLSLDLGEARS